MSYLKYDLSKLQNVRSTFAGILAQCPICAQEGGDSKGAHLIVFKTGAFGCAKYQGVKEHSRKIYEFLYNGPSTDIEEQEEFIYRGTKLKYYPEELLTKLISYYSYWEGRNIPSNIVSFFSGGLASSQDGGKLKGRYVFAVRNKDNKIVGWAGRLIEHSEFAPKWKIIGAKKSFIFPERNLSEKSIKDQKQVILLESVADSMMLFKYGIKNTSVMFGVKPSSQLISYLISLGVQEVIISTNNDSAKNNVGNEASEKIRKQLSLFFNPNNIKIILPQSKDWGCANEQEILDFKKKIDESKN